MYRGIERQVVADKYLPRSDSPAPSEKSPTPLEWISRIVSVSKRSLPITNVQNDEFQRSGYGVNWDAAGRPGRMRRTVRQFEQNSFRLSAGRLNTRDGNNEICNLDMYRVSARTNPPRYNILCRSSEVATLRLVR